MDGKLVFAMRRQVLSEARAEVFSEAAPANFILSHNLLAVPDPKSQKNILIDYRCMAKSIFGVAPCPSVLLAFLPFIYTEQSFRAVL